jgi:pilus assembly protein Flp/PilA
MTYTKSVKLLRDQSGQGVLEYGLILGLAAMVAIGALLFLGAGSTSTFARAAHGMGSSGSGSSGAAASEPAAAGAVRR